MAQRRNGWQRRMADTRARVVDTAVRLFTERGFEQVTVNEIAAAAGTSARTVYRYFPTKEDIVLEPDEFTLFVAMLEQVPPGVSVLRGLADIQAAVTPDGSMVALEAARVELIRTTPALHRAWLESLIALEDGVARWLAKRNQRPENDFDVRVAAAALIGAHRVLVLSWNQHDFDHYLDGSRRILELLGNGFDVLGSEGHVDGMAAETSPIRDVKRSA